MATTRVDPGEWWTWDDRWEDLYKEWEKLRAQRKEIESEATALKQEYNKQLREEKLEDETRQKLPDFVEDNTKE